MASQRQITDSSREGASVTLAGLDKTFETLQGPLSALKNINVTFDPGQFVAIVGPSGCGKSTLLRLVAGLDTPTSGLVKIDNDQVNKPYGAASFVFQQDLLLHWRTALQNVLLHAEMRGLAPADYLQDAHALLSRVGLGTFARSYPDQLSGGMRQRVALARALLIKFPLLLMDEPFGALDALTRDQLNLELPFILPHTPTVLFVTHSIEEAVFLADRVIVMTPRPGTIHVEMSIDMPRPRTPETRESAIFDQYSRRIREEFKSLGVLQSRRVEES